MTARPSSGDREGEPPIGADAPDRRGDTPADPRAGRLGDGRPTVPDDAVALPVEDWLDLHAFRPQEVAEVVAAYIEVAREAGFAEVRIVHGRGHGVLRETVRRVLARSPRVLGFSDAPPERGGWGATVVRLA